MFRMFIHRQQITDPQKMTTPDTKGKKILLSVTGMTPQVVTETLYALAVDAKEPWIPDEIHLVTTGIGAEQARLTLLSQKPGWFHRLCRDYNLPKIAFDSSCIHAITDESGTILEDIRTLQDNDSAANFISETVRRLSSEPGSEIHASLAGGRKTMGFFLGYAMSLFGRPQDRLSHVLVSEPFEGNKEFYYPTLQECVIALHGDKSRSADARDARITLADIPFVRLRDGLPTPLLEGRSSFSEAVSGVQTALPKVSLRLEPATCRVFAGGDSFTLKPSEFALYWVMAKRIIEGRSAVHWSEDSTKTELLDCYGKLVNPFSGDYERALTAYQRGMTKDNFDPAKSHINAAIKKAMGLRLSQPYLIQTLDPIPGTKYRRQGLLLSAADITIATSLPTQHRRT